MRLGTLFLGRHYRDGGYREMLKGGGCYIGDAHQRGTGTIPGQALCHCGGYTAVQIAWAVGMYGG